MRYDPDDVKKNCRIINPDIHYHIEWKRFISNPEKMSVTTAGVLVIVSYIQRA